MKKCVCFRCFWRRWNENGYDRCPDCGGPLFIIGDAESWIERMTGVLIRLTSAKHP